jgi:branched-chain amino acid transport system substrate-binding protein
MKDRLTKVIRALGYGMVAGIFIFLQANLCLAASDEVKIGASISLSGKLTREGHGVQRGYDFWADWVNAKGGVLVGGKKFRVKMVYYDDESNPQTSAKLFEKLITQDRVDIILGPYASGIAMAATTVAERHRYVVILPINNSDEIYNRGYKYVFGQAPVASRDMVPMIDLLMDAAPKPKTLAIIASNSTYPLIVANGCNDYAKKVGLDVVFFEKFPEETSDLSSLLSVIKTKNPDLLIEAGYFEHSVLITKQLKDLGATPRGLVFSIGPQLPDFVKSLGKDAEYALGGAYWHMKMKYKDPAFTVEQYDEMFKQKYGEYPMYLNGYATAAGRLLERALEKAGTIEQEKIREALSKIELTDTIIGKVKFDEGGRNIWGKIGVLQIQKGRDEIVYPHEAATSKLIYPNVPWGQR